MTMFCDVSKIQAPNMREFERFLADAAAQYEKTAPTVETWADDLCSRLADLRNISVFELCQFLALYEHGEWEHPNYAANRCYKVAERIGRERGVISY